MTRPCPSKSHGKWSRPAKSLASRSNTSKSPAAITVTWSFRRSKTSSTGSTRTSAGLKLRRLTRGTRGQGDKGTRNFLLLVSLSPCPPLLFSGRLTFTEDLAQPPRDDFRLARLHLPDADSNLLFFGLRRRRVGRDLDGGFAFAQSLARVVGRERQRGFLPGQPQGRDVIGDGRDVNFGLDRRDFRHAVGDQFGAALPFFPFGLGVALQVHLDGDHHSHHLFLVDLHPAAYGVAVGRAVQPRGFDQIFAAQQQPRALRPPQAFAAG